MKPGTTERFDCPECNTEFEVTLEPKAKDDPKSAKHTDSVDVAVCPFCATEIEEEE